MRGVVYKRWHAFSEDIEGRVPFMYLDNAEPRGLVTVAVGNLCPLSFALGLPFYDRRNGALAGRAQIISEWTRVEERQDLKTHGGKAFGPLTNLRLSEVALDLVVARKLEETDRTLRGMFGEAWEDWPACAQLFACSWAWAAGPNARYPRMLAALHARDFLAAAGECILTPNRGTIVTRNDRNQMLLRNADRVQAYHLDPDTLEWGALIGVGDVETLPDLAVAAENTASSPTIHVDPSLYMRPDPPDEAA